MSEDRLFEVPSPPKQERPRDEIWDALEAEFGAVRTKDERGRRNAAVRQLREAEATPEEIRIAVDFCRRNFSNFSEKAVCSWFSRSLMENDAADGKRATFLRLLQPKEGGS